MGETVYEGITRFLQTFLEVYEKTIDDLYNDKLYERIKAIKKEKLRYEDVEWLFMEENYIKPQASVKDILAIKDANPELKYIQKIVGSDYPYRDKLVLLCGYIEPFIYAQVGINCHGHLKNDIDAIVDKSHRLNVKEYRLLMIYMLIAIIFKDFLNKDYIPDKRLPHRNCILHNGIVSYSDEEVEMAYYTLLVNIYMIYDYAIKNKEIG